MDESEKRVGGGMGGEQTACDRQQIRITRAIALRQDPRRFVNDDQCIVPVNFTDGIPSIEPWMMCGAFHDITDGSGKIRS